MYHTWMVRVRSFSVTGTITMSPRLRLGSRACQIGGTTLGAGSRWPQRFRGKSQNTSTKNTSTNPCFDLFFLGGDSCWNDSGFEGCTNFTLFYWKLSLGYLLFDIPEIAGYPLEIGNRPIFCWVSRPHVFFTNPGASQQKTCRDGGFLFPSSGGEANDCAIRLARLYTGELDCGPLRWWQVTTGSQIRLVSEHASCNKNDS